MCEYKLTKTRDQIFPTAAIASKDVHSLFIFNLVPRTALFVTCACTITSILIIDTLRHAAIMIISLLAPSGDLYVIGLISNIKAPVWGSLLNILWCNCKFANCSTATGSRWLGQRRWSSPKWEYIDLSSYLYTFKYYCVNKSKQTNIPVPFLLRAQEVQEVSGGCHLYPDLLQVGEYAMNHDR